MDGELRTVERAGEARPRVAALLRAGERDGAVLALVAELRRLRDLTVAITRQIEARVRHARIMRATDPDLDGIFAERVAALNGQVAIVVQLRELGVEQLVIDVMRGARS